MAAKLGTTFSQPHLEHLNLNVDEALSTAIELGFARLRLGTYWNRTETSPEQFEWSQQLHLLDRCEAAGQPVVVTLGVKAPRWPEYFWPDHIVAKTTQNPTTQKQILNFTARTVDALQKYTCISHWQVENEPLDPSGPSNEAISQTFLAEEIALVRALDTRPIVITLWGNELVKRGFFTTAVKLADVVGIDLYYKQFITELAGNSFYKGPNPSSSALNNLINASTKPVWVSELQAEPWEKNEANYKSAHPGSISPTQLQKNLRSAQDLAVQEIHYWGFEYWLWRSKNGDSSYLEVVKESLQNV